MTVNTVRRAAASVVFAVLSLAPAAAANRNLPITFEPNRGQSVPSARFLARHGGSVLFFEDAGVKLHLRDSQGRMQHLRYSWAGSRRTRPEAEQPTGGVSHYLTGPARQNWKTGIPHYSHIRYSRLYPGVDLVWYGNAGELEYDLVVAPGADPSRIALRVDGARSLRLDGGDLVIATDAGELRHRRPVAYQKAAGTRRSVTADYTIDPSGNIRFVPGEYDHSLPLVIDPVIAYGMYLGGSNHDRGYGIAVDPAGAAYITGETMSANFPAGSGAQSSLKGAADAFVTKLNPAGTQILWSTYLGGSLTDTGRSIAVDAGGSAYITGFTNSTDFPAFAPLRTQVNGLGDAFLTKLTPSGNAISFSTYLGGTSVDEGRGVAIDSAYNVYVAGETSSMDLHNLLPGSTPRGGSDGFLAKVNANGQSIAFTTYVGGSGADILRSVAVAGAFVYVAGDTTSGDLSGTAFQPSRRGSSDAFLAKLTDGGSPEFQAYLGGSGTDTAQAVAVDPAGNPVVAGFTNSADFPVAAALQPGYAGGLADAFVTRIHSGGQSLLSSTYLGGFGDDRAFAVAVDSQGAVVVGGDTASNNFPVKNSLQSRSISGVYEAFVTKYNQQTSGFVYSTLLAGGGDDAALGLAVHNASSVHVTGTTDSFNLPVTSGTSKGGKDALAFSLDSQCTWSVSPSSLEFQFTGGTRTISVTTGPECAWNATSTNEFLSIRPPSQGIGSGSFAVNVANKSDSTVRGGEVRVGSATIPVTYSGGAQCSYRPTPAGITAPAAGTSGSATFQGQFSCVWQATPKVPWITVAQSSGSVLNPLNYTVAPNPSAAARTGYIDISGDRFDVEQLGAPPKVPISVGTYSTAGHWHLDSDKSFSPTQADQIFAWGSSNAIPVTGDWDGDGRTSVGVFIDGAWYLDFNGNGGAFDSADRAFAWGQPAATPVTGDWNGDGITDVGVWQAGAFYLDLNGNRQLDSGEAFRWGPEDATPVTGDWNGSGRTNIGVYKDGIWTLDLDGDNFFTAADRHFHFGNPGWTPVVGDWGATGADRVGIFKDGEWILDLNGSFSFDSGDPHFQWGNPGAKPVMGDWNGSGGAKVGVYEGSTFTLDTNGDRVYTPGSDRSFSFAASDKPFAGRW